MPGNFRIIYLFIDWPAITQMKYNNDLNALKKYTLVYILVYMNSEDRL